MVYKNVDLKISMPLGQDKFGPVDGIDVNRQTSQIDEKQHGLPEGYHCQIAKVRTD